MWNMFRNTLTILLVAIFAFSPLYGVYEAKAQSSQTQSGGFNTVGSYTMGGGGVTGGLDAYIKGLGPAITQLPLCKKKIRSGIKDIFSKNKKAIAEEVAKAKGLPSSIDEAQAEADAIHNYDKAANKKLEAQSDVLKKIDKATSSIDENDTCLKSIGRMVTKMMLQKITLATVEWIQNGFHGGPAFVQNPGKFFGDIAKYEILEFGMELNLGADCQATWGGNLAGTNGSTNITSPNDCISPYAKIFFQNVAEQFNKRFAENARYSLNELIAATTPEYTGASFRGDFAAGGWNAWLALTTVPANNPVGFGLMAETELSKRLRGVDKSTAEKINEALNQSGGILGDERCADPEGITRDQHRAALENNQPDKQCKRWEYVTPGKVVAEYTTKITNYQDNNLLKAEDLNDAVAAIVDALIQRFANDLFSNGLAAFSNEGADGGLILNAYGITGNYLVNQVEKDYPSYLQGSEWFNEHPNFNLRTDLTQAIIDEQRIYAETLEKQNEVMENIVLWTKQLDYCIPGPSPKKYNEIMDNDLFSDVDNLNKKLDPFNSIFGRVVETVVGNIPIVGGLITSITRSILDKKEDRIKRKTIATQLGLMFNVHIYSAYGYNDYEESEDRAQELVIDQGDMDSLAKRVLASYKEVIYNTYFNGSKSYAPMPLVTNEARVEFNKINAYITMSEKNDDKIGIIKAIISRLAKIKELVEDLGPVPSPSDPNFTQYENDIKPYLEEFGRLTNEMVTGNNIASQQLLLKQLEDKYIYIKNDLLEGPGGCEQEMTKLYQEEPETYSKFYRRQPYQEPIPYLYGNFDPSTPTVVGPPTERVAWGEMTVRNWPKNDAFLYGSIYWNFMARPYDGGNRTLADGKTHAPPDRVKIKQELEKKGCTEFIDVVFLSYPGVSGDTKEPIDLGGLEPEGGGFAIDYGPNTCGVLGQLEDLIGIY